MSAEHISPPGSHPALHWQCPTQRYPPHAHQHWSLRICHPLHIYISDQMGSTTTTTPALYSYGTSWGALLIQLSPGSMYFTRNWLAVWFYPHTWGLYIKPAVMQWNLPHWSSFPLFSIMSPSLAFNGDRKSKTNILEICSRRFLGVLLEADIAGSAKWLSITDTLGLWNMI